MTPSRMRDLQIQQLLELSVLWKCPRLSSDFWVQRPSFTSTMGSLHPRPLDEQVLLGGSYSPALQSSLHSVGWLVVATRLSARYG